MISIHYVFGLLTGSILATVVSIYMGFPAYVSIGMSIGLLLALAGYRKK